MNYSVKAICLSP